MPCIHLIIYWLYYMPLYYMPTLLYDYMPALLYVDFIICRLFASMAPYALKGQKLLAQGNTLGFLCPPTCRPVRAKAFKSQAIYKAFALTGRLVGCHYTQGDALG